LPLIEYRYAGFCVQFGQQTAEPKQMLSNGLQIVAMRLTKASNSVGIK
jgi:hypothetical protein